MHRRPLSRDEIREVDRRAIEEYGIPGIVLMENAAREIVDVIIEEAIDGPFVVCCGKGNNGGDGFVVARHLEATGEDVRVLLFADPDDVTGDAATNLRILERAETPLRALGRDFELDDLDTELGRAGCIVDALLGTGAKGEVREPYATVIEAINRSDIDVLAVDLPSGLDCDTGEPLGPTVRAGITITFVAEKLGFANEAADEYLGDSCVVEIGVPKRLLDEVFGASS